MGDLYLLYLFEIINQKVYNDGEKDVNYDDVIENFLEEEKRERGRNGRTKKNGDVRE